MKSRGVLIGATALAFVLTGCMDSGVIPKTAPGPSAARADQAVAELSSGDFAAVEANFDPTMRVALPVASLQNSWTTYQQLLGAYRRHDAPSSVMKGQLDVERVPVTMANASGEIRITFHPDGTIAGLYFLKAGAPAP